MPPDNEIVLLSVSADELDPEPERRFLLYYEILDNDLEEQLAHVVERKGPDGLRRMGWRLHRVFDTAAEVMTAARGRGWISDRKPAESVVGIELVKWLRAPEALSELHALPHWRKRRLRILTEIRGEFVAVAKESK